MTSSCLGEEWGGGHQGDAGAGIRPGWDAAAVGGGERGAGPPQGGPRQALEGLEGRLAFLWALC